MTLKKLATDLSFFIEFGGGGGKALTMTMTPWNLTHGQWSKNLTMATDTLEFAPWSMVVLWSSLVVKSKVYHFDHRKFAFWPWSWSKWVVLWLNFVVKF